MPALLLPLLLLLVLGHAAAFSARTSPRGRPIQQIVHHPLKQKLRYSSARAVMASDASGSSTARGIYRREAVGAAACAAVAAWVTGVLPAAASGGATAGGA